MEVSKKSYLKRGMSSYWIIITIAISFSVCSGRNLFVSHFGHDWYNCGNEEHPCKTITYTVIARACPPDMIHVENSGIPYFISESITLKQNISLSGYRGAPTFQFYNPKSTRPFEAILFKYSKFVSHKAITLSLSNLNFNGIAAVNQHQGKYNHSLEVRIQNCSFENVQFAVISSNVSSQEQCANVRINILDSKFVRCSYVLFAVNKLRNLVLNVTRSLIKGMPEITRYQGIYISAEDNSLLSAQVYIMETNFVQLDRCLCVSGAKGEVSVYKSSFIESGLQSSAFRVAVTPVLLSESTFVRNKKGAVYLYLSKALVNNCTFLHNQRGAYGQVRSRSKLIDCYFEKNKALLGGAIHNRESSFLCVRCKFLENYADIQGGTIYHVLYAHPLYILNCSISLAKEPPKYGLGGEVFYVERGSHTISNTVINASEGSISYRSQRSLIVNNIYNMMDNVTVQCPTGWNTSVNGLYNKRDHSFSVLRTWCSSCPSNYYSLRPGKVLFSWNLTKGYKADLFSCFPCPYGGRCSSGIVKAQDNFWGMQINDQGQIEFVRCPVDYCCRGNKCQEYSSCSDNRVGVLCGRCKEGYSEDSVTPSCLPKTKCKKIWFWVTFIFATMLYVIFFIYMKEIVHSFGKLFGLKKAIKQDTKYDPSQANDEDLEADRIFSLNTVTRRSDNVEMQNARDKAYFSGFIKVSFFFYQIQALFSMSFGPDEHVTGVFEAFQKAISNIFNLKLNEIYHGKINLCPFTGLHAVTKVLLRPLFIVCIIIVFGIIEFIYEMYKLKINRENHQTAHSFRVRILCSLLQTLLLGYSGLTASTMALLKCISLRHLGSVLFIDGNITCYTWWQYVLFAVVAFWIVPFPMALYVASLRLAKHQLSIKMFFLALGFPLPFIVCSTFNACTRPSSENDNSQLSRRLTDSSNVYLISDQYPADIEAVLDVLSGPFRYTTKPSAATKAPLIWEPILILRRLVLICVYTFVLNPVIRLYIMLVLLLLFLIHHQFVMPYSSRILNIAETVSLMTLCVLCSMSTIPAYNYAYPLTAAEKFKDVLYIFSYTETFCMTVIPLLVAVILCVAILMRILHLFWFALKHFVLIARSVCLNKYCKPEL